MVASRRPRVVRTNRIKPENILKFFRGMHGINSERNNEELSKVDKLQSPSLLEHSSKPKKPAKRDKKV